MKELDIFVKRLQKINIITTYIGNYPWVYLHTVNNITVKEKNDSEHGFVIGYMPIRNDQTFQFSENLSYIFKIIRKYANR